MIHEFYYPTDSTNYIGRAVASIEAGEWRYQPVYVSPDDGSIFNYPVPAPTVEAAGMLVLARHLKTQTDLARAAFESAVTVETIIVRTSQEVPLGYENFQILNDRELVLMDIHSNLDQI